MKRKILLTFVFFVASLCKMFALGDYAQSFTVMMGETITVYPQDDCGFLDPSLNNNLMISGSTYSMTYNDNTGLTVTPTKIDNKRYKYDITALRTGTYQLVITTTYYLGNSGPFTRKATYNIKIVDVTKINMPSSLNLQPGDIYTLTPQILETGATSPLTWTSSNTGVALVDQTGKIRVLRVGTTNITCTAYNGVSATCKLTVVPIIAEDFSLAETSCELEPGETFMLSPVFTPTNTSDQSVTYKSSNPKVATVDADGMITGVNMGACFITASTNDGSFISATCAVTVKPIVTSIYLQGTMEMIVGQNETLVPVVMQEGAATILTWRSSNSSVATVSSDGYVYAVSAGKTTISCTATNGVTANCEVTVNPQPNYLYSAGIAGCIGHPCNLSVSMANESLIKGIQFDIQLPEGVTIPTNAQGNLALALTNRAHSSHSISATKLSSGKYRMVVSSQSAQIFNGSDGVIMNITLEIARTARVGNYDVILSSIVINTEDNISITPIDMTCQMTIAETTPGDVNGDGRVNVTDVGMVIDHILENTPAGFIIAAADVNGDGKVNVTDVGLIIDIILSDDGIQVNQRMDVVNILIPQ